MTPQPLSVFAVTLGDQVDTYGAYIGVAAFFGLAILIVLHFAQARELKRLREWAGRSPERARDLEERVAAQAEGAAQARPEPVRPAVPVAQPLPVPAGGARLGTIVHPAAAAIPAATAAATATAAAALRAPAAAATPAASPTSSPPAQNGTGSAAAVPPPMPAPAPAPAPAKRAVTQPPRRPATAPAGARRAGPTPRRSKVTAGFIGLGVVAALAGLTFLGLQLFGGDESVPAPAPNQVADAPGTAPPGGAPSVTATRGRTTVAVFNGTTSAGLAQNLFDRLTGAGYAEDGNVDTAPDQSAADSTVYFARGQQRQARDAARILEISDTEPMDADDRALAGPNAELLVIVGADKTP